MHRSLYQLKEADPHTFVVPAGPGCGQGRARRAAVRRVRRRPARAPARHPVRRGAGRVRPDRSYGAYVDAAPACTLALNNAMSLLCLHRRLRAAAMGHLAAIEVTSSLPCRKYVQGLRRLELSPAMVGYFDEHVEADAVHEQVATREHLRGLVEQEPGWPRTSASGWRCPADGGAGRRARAGLLPRGPLPLRTPVVRRRWRDPHRPARDGDLVPEEDGPVVRTAPAGRGWCAARTRSRRGRRRARHTRRWSRSAPARATSGLCDGRQGHHRRPRDDPVRVARDVRNDPGESRANARGLVESARTQVSARLRARRPAGRRTGRRRRAAPRRR